MHSEQRLFNIARFEHENEMRRKALQQKKKFGIQPFLESGIQYSESGIHRVESRIQDCHGFPYMGRPGTSSLDSSSSSSSLRTHCSDGEYTK